jgi:hypothetical protein
MSAVYENDAWQMTWVNHIVTRGMHWLDVNVPRGPITGCHVAPQFLSIWFDYQNLCRGPDSNSRPPGGSMLL